MSRGYNDERIERCRDLNVDGNSCDRPAHIGNISFVISGSDSAISKIAESDTLTRSFAERRKLLENDGVKGAVKTVDTFVPAAAIMDEIVPGLWVGGHRAASDPDYLSRAGITHIISCMKQRLLLPLVLPDGREIVEEDIRQVRLDDDEKAPILVHFDSCNDYITQVLEEEWNADSEEDGETVDDDTPVDLEQLVQGRQKQGSKWGTWQTTGSGTVLVHCQAGCSRSVALVAAYLMSTRRITAEEAVDMIKIRRSAAQPNPGFMAQLELYHQVHYEIDMRHQAVRRFLMSKTDILNGDSMDDMLLSYYPSPYPSPSMSGTLKGLTPLSLGDDSTDSNKGATSTATPMRSRRPSAVSGSAPASRPRSASVTQLGSIGVDADTPDTTPFHLKEKITPTRKTDMEFKVTASHGRLPGGVTHIRGNEGRDNQGRLARPQFAGPKLRCRSCRRELAALDHVVLHEPGKGQMAFDHRRRDTGFGKGQNVPTLAPLNLNNDNSNIAKDDAANDASTASVTAATGDNPQSASAAPTRRPIQSAASLASQLPPHLAALRGASSKPTPAPTTEQTPSSQPTSSSATAAVPTPTRSSMLHSAECSSYFTEPMAWMSALGDGQVTGRLNCPNGKCEQKLGSWDWAGMQCGCGAWVTPAFALHRSKVDEI